ncbi:MAG: hypothetical protein RR623_08365 [Bacilli bacterium]
MKNILILFISSMMIIGCSSTPKIVPTISHTSEPITTPTEEPIETVQDKVKKLENIGFVVSIEESTESKTIFIIQKEAGLLFTIPNDVEKMDLNNVNFTTAGDNDLITVYNPISNGIMNIYNGDPICLYDLTSKTYYEQDEKSMALCDDNTLNYYTTIKELYDATFGSVVENPYELWEIALWINDNSYQTTIK